MTRILTFLATHGEPEAAELYRADPNEFDRRGKSGREYFHGVPEDNLPEWLHEVIRAVTCCMMVSTHAPAGAQCAEADGLHEVLVYPTLAALHPSPKFIGRTIHSASTLDLGPPPFIQGRRWTALLPFHSREISWNPVMLRPYFVRHLVRSVLPIVLVSFGNAEEPLRLRVLSYNIHHGQGVDGRLDLERIARVIKSADPDVVALQEVDLKTKRTRNVDQPAELGRLTGMKVVFGKNLDFQGGGYGNAVLSRLPITRHKNHHLPNLDDGEQRGVLVVELRPEGTKSPILLFATHLDHRPKDRERFASADMINELLAKSPGTSSLLAGDLNDTPNSRTLDAFRKKWTSASKKEQPTVPVGKPERQIDYVLFQPAQRWKIVEVRVLDEAVASDHRAILAVLELKIQP
ncbi:MAG: endonuclease/exonuclease/phosphatase family protein [Planctomycetales bacterium]